MEDKVIKLSNSRVSQVPGRESAKLLGNAVGLKAESEYQRPLRLGENKQRSRVLLGRAANRGERL